MHGALVVLEQNSFTSDSLAGILNIPTSVPLVHKHLATELALLLSGRVKERCVCVCVCVCVCACARARAHCVSMYTCML